MPGTYSPCIVPQIVHVNTGGSGPQNPQYGPIGDAWTGIGMCGGNAPAHMSGTIDPHELQPA
jgi:hypothetical protein